MAAYSVPQQSKQVFEEGIVRNQLIAHNLPSNAEDFAAKIKYTGSEAPSIPVNWRYAESISALKGLEAVMVLALLKEKYGVDVQEVTINT